MSIQSPNESSPIAIDTLISAGWIIPIRPEKTQLQNHAIAIKDGTIVDILPHTQAQARYDAQHGIDLPNHVLTPGLINCHGHSPMSLFRGIADDTPLHSWLNDHIWPAEAQYIDEVFAHDGSQLAIAEMLRSGTTTFSDMYLFPNITAKAAAAAGIRAQIAMPIINFPSAWAQDPDDYIRKGLAVRDDFKHSQLVDVVFGPHSLYTVNDASLQKIAILAAELDLNIHIHLHETQHEIDIELASSGQRPLAKLNDLGLLSSRTQLVHMTVINDDDIELLKQTGAHVIHCPNSNMKLASGLCPVKQLQDNGINVALGTDGAASNNSLDMLVEMRSAALLAKAVAKDAAALGAWAVLEAATLNGAKALGMEHKIGSLEIGKEADIIAINLSALEQQPVYQAISQLVYTHCSHQVSHSWVRGELVLEDRQPTQMELGEIIAKAQSWHEKITG